MEAAGVRLEVRFWSPALPKDLDALSTPITFVDYTLSALDGKTHEAEIRLTAGFRIVSCRQKPVRVITGIDMKPVPPDKIENMPGIIGYMVKPKDTLWSVARKFYVPLASIREVNSLTGDELKPGQRLLIVK